MDGQTGPVTVSIARKAVPGREADYEAWISRVTAEVSRWPGYQGVNVLRPAAATEYAYVTIYRFSNWEQCHAFEKSEERAEFLLELEGMVEGEGLVKRVTGLEFWFDLPEVPAQIRPSPHKMALVVTLVAYGVVMGLSFTVGPQIAGLPVWLRALIMVTAQVVLMTYVFMPQVTRLLRPWLFGR
ncbi:antibiotic biosynthesis monooxygenase [Magnetospirillum sp. 15-1]|uniref:antibiotic biosynthesis monooxygenase n=1 Tax=Magnetospirillum sp. 15-1 TaxID=1979370 RepID=UPI000BBC7D77|nr:antibiotic biosynthesis monooxygenase [Magnetospirillum sp. 15-1]